MYTGKSRKTWVVLSLFIKQIVEMEARKENPNNWVPGKTPTTATLSTGNQTKQENQKKKKAPFPWTKKIKRETARKAKPLHSPSSCIWVFIKRKPILLVQRNTSKTRWKITSSFDLNTSVRALNKATHSLLHGKTHHKENQITKLLYNLQ